MTLTCEVTLPVRHDTWSALFLHEEEIADKSYKQLKKQKNILEKSNQNLDNTNDKVKKNLKLLDKIKSSGCIIS